VGKNRTGHPSGSRKSKARLPDPQLAFPGGVPYILCIDTNPLPPAAATNPYRAILRRDYPRPLVALLAFLLGIWIWDHYFGKSEGYPPGTGQIALLRIDRDLRLADAMATDPPWLRWMAGVGTQEVALDLARKSLQLLGEEGALGSAGIEAFAVVDAEIRGGFGFFRALYYAGSRSLLAVIVLHSLYHLSIKLPEWIVYHLPLG